MTDRVVAFVHAKGTSDRVVGKNMRRLGDKPLFCHAIENARRAARVDCVVIDSDSDEILEIGAQYGARPLKRSAALATNRTSGDALAFWQASNYPESKIVLQVIPTAPFLQPRTIDAAIDLIETAHVDSVVGTFSEVFYRWENGRPAYYREDGSLPNSSELAPIVYETTGLYVNRTKAVLETKRRMNQESCSPIGVSRIEAIDINTEDDFAFAEIVWKGLERSR